tara:strand:+ start:441 stop:1757 length:1317 start_codon:yes stop_codon:yes gene_type:complete
MKDKAKKEFYNKQVRDHTNLNGYGYSYASDGLTMFYAGTYNHTYMDPKTQKQTSINNWGRAKAYAKANGMKPIYETKSGRYLDNNTANEKAIAEDKTKTNKLNDYFGRWDMKRIWTSASRSYAARAEGSIRTFVAGASEYSIFRRTELPTILNNKKVTNINGVDRKDLQAQRKQEFKKLRAEGIPARLASIKATAKIHNIVTEAELKIDMKKAELSKDKMLRRDVQKRAEDQKTQNKIEAEDFKQRLEMSKHKDAFVEKYTSDRFKAIEKKTYDKKIRSGLDHATANLAAKHRVKQVQERAALMQVNMRLRDQGENLKRQDSLIYYRASHQHRETVKDDKDILSKKIQGVNHKDRQRTNAQKADADIKCDSRKFTFMVRLDAAKEKGKITEQTYISRKDNIEKTIERERTSLYKENNIGRHYASARIKTEHTAPKHTI